MNELTIPQNQDIEVGIQNITQKALEIKVTDDTTNLLAGEIFSLHKKMEKEITDFFAPHVEAANKVHKGLTEARRLKLLELKPGIDHLNAEMVRYKAEQDEIRRKEEERLREIERKKEEDRILAEAAQAEQDGNHEEAAAIVEQPIYVPPVKLAAAPKPAGVGFSTRYHAEVENLMELVKAVADGKAPIQAVQANMVFLNSQAVAFKETLNYPGVKAVGATNAGRGRS